MQNTDSTLDFLEFAALEPVRQAIASGDAVAVFNEGLERVIQSNRSMAALFGFKSVEAFLEAGLIASPTARRQFMQAVSALEHHGEAQNVMVRIASGMRSRLTPAHVEKVRLPSGEEAVAIACAGGRFGVAPATIAAELVGERDSAATAAFDASGATIAASRRFAALGVDASEIASLLRSVEPGMEARENRAVDTAAGRFAALALRLHDDPFLALVTIDENRLFAGEKAEGEVDAKSSAAMRDVADDTARAAVSGDRAASPFAGRFTSRRPSLPGETRAGAPVAPRWYFRGPIAGSAAVPADAEVARERESQIPVQSPDEETLFGGGMSTVPSSASGDEHSLPEAQTMHETDEHRDSEAGHKDAASGSATDLAPRWSAKSPPPLPMLNAWGLRPSEPVETAREAALETEFAQAPAGEASGSFSFGDDKSRPPLPLVADDESEAEILSGYDNDDAGGDESWPGLIATVPERDEYDDPGAAPDAYLVDAREDAEDLESLRRLDGADAPERERSFVSDPARAGFETIGDPAIAADKRVPERATSAAENDAVDPAREVDTPTAAEPLAAKPAADTGRLSGPVRFVWKMDGELRFTEASPEFARAVGPNAADIIGRTFRDVATVFGLDPQNEIQAMLDRRDTWSGRIVLWPVQGTDLRVPVELAALPAYGRGRLFEGYRGFGIARMHDAVVDPEELGLSLTPHPAAGPEADSAIAANAADGDDDRSQGQETPPSAGIGDFEPAPTALTDVEHSASATPDPMSADDPFRGETPALTVSPRPMRRLADTVIKLDERRPRKANVGSLSDSERDAFRSIGEKLNRDAPEAAKGEAGSTMHDAETHNLVGEARSADSPDRDDSEREADDFAPAPHIPFGDDPTGAEGETRAIRAESAWLEDQTGARLPSAMAFPIRNGDDGASGGAKHVASTFHDDGDSKYRDDNGGDAGEAGSAGRDMGATTSGLDNGVGDDADSRTPEETPSHPDPAPRPADTSILDILPIAVLIHSGDTLHYANPEFLALSGYSSLEALNRAGGIDVLIVDGDQRAGDGQPRRLTMRRRSGATLPVAAHLRSAPWRGGHALLLTLKPDIQPGLSPVSGGRGAPSLDERALKARVDELTHILDTATDGVVLIDSDCTIRSLNQSASALFGYDNRDVSGKSFSILFAQESQRAAMDYLNGLSDHGVASVLNEGREVLGREAGGGFIPLFMTIGALGTTGGFCAVLRDITHWKQTEDALNEARRDAEAASTQKSEFLARISHEIRTPLNSIIGFSELMMEERFGTIGNARYREYLSDINRSGRHVLDLVNDLLDLSKIEAGRQDLEFESVALNDALSEAISMMQPQANRERVIIRSSLASRLPPVVADRRSVKQIAINLLSNAVRFTPAGGQVIVATAYEATGDVVIRIRDTGIGMSQKEIELAMKPFRQVVSASHRRDDGTGLGLPLTKALVEANRADFVIDSTPGKGTTVEIHFPSTRVLAD